MLFAAYYFANRMVRSFGKGLRPREDIPSALRMHRNSIFIFLAGIGLTFLGGVAALVGAVICGTFGAGFLMSGYASLHYRSRGKDWRWPVLVLAYLSAVFMFPLIIILVLGLSDVRSTIALTPAKDPNKPNETNS
jgi:ABC-type amino acid transport system permease subunit